MKDYHDLYLKCDVLLLADVFEKFRNNSLENYGLWCESHYLSRRAWTWDAVLNMTKVRHELMSDADMHLFFEKGVGGGVSDISKIIAKLAISIWNLMTLSKNQKVLFTSTGIAYMVIQCLSFFQQAKSNGLIQMKLT